jgi:hypothetical protein
MEQESFLLPRCTKADLSAPGLSAAKTRRSVRLPEDGDQPIPDWANEIPLLPTEMSRTRNEGNPLIKAAELDSKPALVFAVHVRAIMPVANSPNRDASV